jgi:hypothetical protein
MSPLASLYTDTDTDTIAALYTTLHALDPVLGLDIAASLDAAAVARPRCRCLP